MMTKRATAEDTGTCPYCEEPVLEGEEIVRLPHVETCGTTIKSWHHECMFRSIIGSVEHLKHTRCGRLPCDGSCATGNAGISRRESARQSRAFWEAHRNQVN